MTSQAIILCGGQQHMVHSKAHIYVNRLDLAEGATFETDAVLYAEKEGGNLIGQPYIEGAKVQGLVVKHLRGEKVIVFKQKRRKNYRRKKGHRQELTHIQISEIKLP